jgi:short-subunit dehydrogenase
MLYPLSNRYPLKRAFITGAGSGLGKALCLELAADGWTIGICDIHASSLNETKAELIARGAKPLTYALDVSDRVNYQIVAQQFIAEAGGIDLLINNAGIGDGGNFEEYPLDEWERMVRINQMSVIYGCHFFIPEMKKQHSGHIINIASLAAITCAPQMGPYNVTKAAVLAISETLYGELLDDGIHVSCVMPAYFRTNIAESVRGGDRIKRITQAFIERSRLDARTVAHEILIRAGKKELYILLPKAARKLWLLKRLMPVRFRQKVKEQYLAAINRIR